MGMSTQKALLFAPSTATTKLHLFYVPDFETISSIVKLFEARQPRAAHLHPEKCAEKTFIDLRSFRHLDRDSWM